MIEERSPQPPDEPEANESAPKWASFWRELPILVVVAVVVALLVRTLVLQSFWIPSGSMENTLTRGDRVLVDKLVYDFRQPERGEIVVFKAPMSWRSDPREEDFIKRVIAVGGDTVSYRESDGRLSVNGEPLNEASYLYADPVTGHRDSPSKNDYEFSVTVPDDRLWVMGDHRSSSGDSRENYIRTGGDIDTATITDDALVGHAFAVIWPQDRWNILSVPSGYESIPEQR